jgi:Tol biopolymer transport system component
MRRTFLAFLATLAACGTATAPGDADQSPLEAIPFDAVGHGTIAFQRSFWSGRSGDRPGVYVVDVDASKTWLLDRFWMSAPAISPDARQFAYVSSTPQSLKDFTFENLYVTNAHGTGETQVTSLQGSEGPPSWTVSGSQLVFAASTDLFSPRRQFFSQSVFANSRDATRLTVSGDDDTCTADNAWEAPSISLNGDLVFSCGTELFVMSAGSGSSRRLYSLPAPGGAYPVQLVASPRWSRDGQRIAFIEANTTGVVYVPTSVAVVLIQANGTGRSVVATLPATGRTSVDGAGNYSLCWTRNDERLVFNVSEGDAVSHIWSVRPDGTGLTRITSNPRAWDRSVSCSR